MTQFHINLHTKSDGPDVKYTTITYPAGEMQVRIKPEYIEELSSAHEVIIRARLTEKDSGIIARNIINLALLEDAIRGVNSKARLILHVPYLPYARADRRFVPGDCHGLAVFADLLNAMHFNEIHTLDAHHHKRADLYIRGLRDIQPNSLIKSAIEDFKLRTKSERITILFPDEGAVKRYSHELFAGHQILCASKVRNTATGQFIGFDVPDYRLFETNAVLIVDDICDGGGTFVGISKALLDQEFVPRQGLYVTHGIFSKGFEDLYTHFEVMYTSNSVYGLPCNGFRFIVSDAFEALVHPDNKAIVTGVGHNV